MPLYEWLCQECTEEFETEQSYKDPNPKCRRCQGPTTKLLSLSSFVLKGSGWYRDGYDVKKQGSN